MGLKYLVLLLIINYAQSANILYVIPFSAMSHYISLRPIGLELARRGHNVTVITTNIEEDAPPNYHQVRVVKKTIWNVLGGEAPNVFTMAELTAEEFHNTLLWPAGSAFTELTLSSPEVREFLKKDNTFDLVICEQFYLEALFALSVKYKAPLALVSTFGNCMRHNMMTRNPLQLATVVSEYLDIKEPGSFFGRLRNFYFSYYDFFWWRYWYLDKQEALVKKYLPELTGQVPSLYDIQRNASLMLTNSHFSYDTPVALLPNIVEVGGLHLISHSQSNTSLPNDLQKLLDEAKHGVVYVSFGSNIRSVELPEEKKRAFLNVFGRLKQTVLWKWEDEVLEGKPKNLVTRTWLPQRDVLAHPNIKAFIAHGGLIGVQEAIYNGVPIVGFPIYADQYNNLLLLEQAGVGKKLKYQDINEETLGAALDEVLNDESYMRNAKELQKRWKDRPLNALDTAMFWLEYVIRNKGANYWKNPAINMTWIAYNMIDVYLFVFLVFISVILFVTKVVSLVLSFLNNSKPKKIKKKSQ